MSPAKVIDRLKKEIDPFRHPEKRTRKDYILVFGLFAIVIAVVVLAIGVSIVS